MVMVKVVSIDEVVEMLKNINKDILFTIRLATDADLLKKGNPYNRVIKVQDLQCYIGSKMYEEQVNDKLQSKWKQEKMVDPNAPEPQKFVAMERPFGTHVDGTPLIKHEKNVGSPYYCQISCVKSLAVGYFDEKLNKISTDAVRPFFKNKKEGTRQIESGLDPYEVIVYRTPWVGSFVSMQQHNSKNLIQVDNMLTYQCLTL
jgi:hypothetical protein